MPKAPASPARLEAFSDGVIAVIITIMVLDLKVPALNGLAGFLPVLPTICLYLLSFTFVGVYWVNHHHLVRRTDQVGEGILYANLFYLFWLSLLPFMTSYVMEKRIDPFSVLLYVVLMILIGGSFLLLRLAIGQHLRQTGRLEREDQAAERKHWLSLAMYLVAAALSFAHPNFALAIIALIMVIWIVPTAKVDPIGHVDKHCSDVQARKRAQT